MLEALLTPNLCDLQLGFQGVSRPIFLKQLSWNEWVRTEINREIFRLVFLQVHSLPHVGGIINVGLGLLFSYQHMLTM